MNGEQRRDEIVKVLRAATAPVSGLALAKEFNVARQVIVQDIALLRAKDIDVHSTNRGYVLGGKKDISRIFKVIHSDEETETELNAFVDFGGRIQDVFIYHKVYGVVRAELNLSSRREIRDYMAELRSGKSSFLKNVTSGYHYHTVSAPDEETLDLIRDELDRLGFLAKLQEYEPVDFWHSENE